VACSLCHEIELNAWNHDILETACWHIAVIHPDAAKAAGLLRCINAPAKILNPHIESASGTVKIRAQDFFPKVLRALRIIAILIIGVCILLLF